jgi:hypothetical protein
LHFGFNRPDSSVSTPTYSKDINDKKVQIVWKDRGDKRVVDISELAVKLSDADQADTNTPKVPYHSAKFAVDMIEGVERVQFSAFLQ